jgi:hypothetical protein
MSDIADCRAMELMYRQRAEAIRGSSSPTWSRGVLMSNPEDPKFVTL